MAQLDHALPFDPPRRERSRLATRLPAQLTTIGGQANGILFDLSLTGARVRLALDNSSMETPKIGGGAELAWHDYSAFGFVAWVRQTREWTECGIEFDQIIAPKTLISTRDVQDAFWEKGGFTTLDKETARCWVQGQRI